MQGPPPTPNLADPGDSVTGGGTGSWSQRQGRDSCHQAELGREEPLKGSLGAMPSRQRGLERRDLHQHQPTTGTRGCLCVRCLVGRAEQWFPPNFPPNFQPTFSTESKTSPCVSPPRSASKNCLLFPKILRGRRDAGFSFPPHLRRRWTSLLGARFPAETTRETGGLL